MTMPSLEMAGRKKMKPRSNGQPEESCCKTKMMMMMMMMIDQDRARYKLY